MVRHWKGRRPIELILDLSADVGLDEIEQEGASGDWTHRSMNE